ncbi:MAG: S41 family peptidase [Alloprevotella sp.]
MKSKLLLFLLLLPVALFAQPYTNSPQDNRMREQVNPYGDLDFEQVKKLQMAQVAITCLYVDSVDQQKLVEDAINGILSKLDPHSSYTNASDTKKLNEPLTGNFEGIGVSFNMVEDTLLVLQVIGKGPCQKAGVLAGDRIISCNDRTIAGVKMDRDTIMSILRGPKGTKARLQIVRRGVDEPLFFDVIRDKIPLNTLDAGYMLNATTGYIRLESFGATSGVEVHDKIKELRKQGMKDLILDLTANGGGLMSAAQDVATEFLPQGSMVVYAEGRTAPRQELKATSGGLMQKEGRVVVLVDETTASAAEIVSGAIQDHDRGVIIGRRTFGKGLVQRPVDLPDGSMIRLTVSHYYTPSGRCVQKPYKKGDKKSYDKDLDTRYEHGELTCLDSIRLDSTKVYKTLVKGRTVYGGGGIMPDIFVPLDTTLITPFYRQLRRHNLINEQVLKFVDANRQKIQSKHKKFDSYIKDYSVPAELIDAIFAAAEKKKVTPKDDEERKKTIEQLEISLKELIAYDIWDRNEYFRLVNRRNDILKRALEYLETGK